MNAIKRFITTVPAWAYALVLVVVYANTIYLVNRMSVPRSGETIKFENGWYIHDYVKPGSTVDRAGIREGDTLVSINSMPVEEWEASSYQPKVGDTVVSGILRNNNEIRIHVIVGSLHSYAPGFFWFIYLLYVLFSVSSLWLLYKKPREKPVLLIFIYFQAFLATMNAQHQSFTDPLTVGAELTFLILGTFLSCLLIHFHLVFPRPVKFMSRYKALPVLLYFIGTVFTMSVLLSYFINLVSGGSSGSAFAIITRIALWWFTISFVLALAVAIYQYYTIHDTLLRNQLRIVIIGAFFSCITPIAITLFYQRLTELMYPFPQLLVLSHGIGGILMILCFLIAIFRYRIWNTEVVLKKALLYLGATFIIILNYLLVLFIADILTISGTKATRFIILAFSVIVFLMLRDRLQKLIDRIFHRETYDSATVVSDFEEKMAGVFSIEELGSGIGMGLEEIFHFSSFGLILKKSGQNYDPVFFQGMPDQNIMHGFQTSREFERMLLISKVFSPGELEQKPAFLENNGAELVIPMIKDNQPFGFFLCGPKKSEKSYSMQDIRVLSLIAKRVIALFQTAGLYQKDLDRQLMLERERARISQDMHDDIGASLTRISMMSEMVKNRDDIGDGARQWLGQISGTSRGLMEEMNQIIWALNPKNDNIEGLLTYVRRFAFEYLEPAAIKCHFDLPQKLQEKKLSVETRRNIYLVVREALHNVVKHSGATRVDIRFSIFDFRFSISIMDDGKGFDQDKLEFPGNGLVNMKKRMNDIGGEIMIKSEPSSGTEIELKIALK